MFFRGFDLIGRQLKESALLMVQTLPNKGITIPSDYTGMVSPDVLLQTIFS